MCFSYVCSIFACLDLSVSSSSWGWKGLQFMIVALPGLLLPFFYYSFMSMKIQEKTSMIHFKHKYQSLDQQKYSYHLRTSTIYKGIYTGLLYVLYKTVLILSSRLENTICHHCFCRTCVSTQVRYRCAVTRPFIRLSVRTFVRSSTVDL